MSIARQYHHQMIHFLRKSIAYTDEDTAVTIGIIPSGSVILKALSGVTVSTAFNAATTNQLDIGNSGDPNLYGTLLALGATDFVPLDEAVSYLVTQDTTITATVTLTGTAATAGAAEVTIAYIPDTDG